MATSHVVEYLVAGIKIFNNAHSECLVLEYLVVIVSTIDSGIPMVCSDFFVSRGMVVSHTGI